MRPRFIVHAIVATLLVGGIAVVADAVVETDQEQLDELVADLTSSPSRTDALLRWTDLSREPVAVTRGRERAEFGEDDDRALAESLAEALAPLEAPDLDVVQRSVRVEGDRATVAVRVRAGSELHDASVRLARSGQGWIVTALRVR